MSYDPCIGGTQHQYGPTPAPMSTLHGKRVQACSRCGRIRVAPTPENVDTP